MTELASRPTTDLPDPDVVCLRCGYNLRGLAPTGRCPECGDPIPLSMRGDLLRYANCGWLHRVKIGLDLVYYSITISVVAAGAILFKVAMGSLPSPLPTYVWVVAALILFGAPIAATLGMILLTAREPRKSLTEGALSWRRLVRVFAIGGIAATIISLSPLVRPLRVAVFNMLPGLVLLLCVIALVFSCFAHLESFGRRVPDRELAGTTRIVKWGLTVPLALGALFMMIPTYVLPLIIAGRPISTATIMAMGSSSCGHVLVILPTLVFGLFALRVLLRYRKAFSIALREAAAGTELPIE